MPNLPLFEVRWFDPLSWGAPYPVVVAALYVIVCLRAGGTYALGRAIAAGTSHTRLHGLTTRRSFARARGLVARWGAPFVTASFLTIGLQTMVNLAAGVLRMPLRRYLPALAVGALVWALVYATVGFVGFAALAHLHERSPLAAWAVGILCMGGILGFGLWQLSTQHQTDDRLGPQDPA